MPSPSHTWIDRQDPDQLVWIDRYLSRHSYPMMLPVDHAFYSPVPDAHALILQLDRYMGDPLFRERYRKMQAAWRKAKSRRRSDRQTVTYHLSKETLKSLDTLAKKQGMAKTHMLEILIRDARYHQEQARKEIQKIKEDYRDRKQRDHRRHQTIEQVNRKIIEGLLDALAEMIVQHSRQEAQAGLLEHGLLDYAPQIHFQEVLREKMNRVYSHAPDLKTQHPVGGSLKQRIDKLTSMP